MVIALVILILAGLTLFIILGYKGSKESKNKPDQIKDQGDKN